MSCAEYQTRLTPLYKKQNGVKLWWLCEVPVRSLSLCLQGCVSAQSEYVQWGWVGFLTILGPLKHVHIIITRQSSTALFSLNCRISTIITWINAPALQVRKDWYRVFFWPSTTLSLRVNWLIHIQIVWEWRLESLHSVQHPYRLPWALSQPIRVCDSEARPAFLSVHLHLAIWQKLLSNMTQKWRTSVSCSAVLMWSATSI